MTVLARSVTLEQIRRAFDFIYVRMEDNHWYVSLTIKAYEIYSLISKVIHKLKLVTDLLQRRADVYAGRPRQVVACVSFFILCSSSHAKLELQPRDPIWGHARPECAFQYEVV